MPIGAGDFPDPGELAREAETGDVRVCAHSDCQRAATTFLEGLWYCPGHADLDNRYVGRHEA